jgi:formate dehydrogenase iron-sulfur subunit
MNQIARTIRLNRSALYERSASARLLNSYELRGTFLVSFAFVVLAVLLALAGMPFLSLPAVFAGILSFRYLFFVSVVPLNMALTFVRSVHA